MHSSPERKLSPWVQHVMKVMNENKCSLKDAMKLASKTYR